MRNFVSFAVIFAISGTASFAAAQHSSQSLNIDAIRAASQKHLDEAEALAETVRRRSDALKTDARRMQTQANANHQSYVQKARQASTNKTNQIFDFDQMISDQAKMIETELASAPRFIVFVSLSMPKASLQAISRDMAAAGGVVVLRGFPGGSQKKLVQMLPKMASGGEELAALGIDPRLFRAFDVKAAPTFIMASSDFDLCDGFDCIDQLPPHDRMTGHVSTRFVLETFASGGGPGAQMAALHLDRFKKERGR